MINDSKDTLYINIFVLDEPKFPKTGKLSILPMVGMSILIEYVLMLATNRIFFYNTALQKL